MKKYILISFTFLTVLCACNNSKTNKIERADDPDIYSVESDDIEMNRVIQQAIDSFYLFEKALKMEDSSLTDFVIKKRFIAPNDEAEHMWISDVYFKDGNYYGILNNNPEMVTDVQLGDTIKIERDDISDWMYLRNGVLQGGYSIMLLRSKMTETEKKQFDQENDFIIEDK